MKCCDEYLLGSILDVWTYEQIVLANGIANSIYSFEYEGESIKFPCGRWQIDFLMMLKDMGIHYTELSFEEVESMHSYEDIIILVPKEFLRYGEKIRWNHIQIATVYTAFQIKECCGDQYVLSLPGPYGDIQEKIGGDLLKKIRQLKVVPFESGLRIIKISKKLYDLRIIDSMKENLMLCRENAYRKKERYECFSGPQFYVEFEKCVAEFFEAGSLTSIDRVKSHIFISTLNAGGEGFFRGSFFKQYLKYKNKGDKDLEPEIQNEICMLICLWNEICRKLRMAEKEEMNQKFKEPVFDMIQLVREKEM